MERHWGTRTTRSGGAALVAALLTAGLLGCAAGQSVADACALIQDAKLAGELAAGTSSTDPAAAAESYQAFGAELEALDGQVTNSEVSPGMTAFVESYQSFLSEYESFIADPEGADIAALGVAADELADAGESLTTSCTAGNG